MVEALAVMEKEGYDLEVADILPSVKSDHFDPTVPSYRIVTDERPWRPGAQ